MNQRLRGMLLLAGGALLALACGVLGQGASESVLSYLATDAPPATQVIILPYSTPTPIPLTATPIPPSETPTVAPTPTPYGCQKPPDDYTIVHVAPDMIVNQRTLTMLQHAQELYSGSHNFVKAITQGSYNPGLDASFGTHDGGGAADISVRDFADWDHILTEDFPQMILSLREAGFAAWVRETDELYAGSTIHIHAIAVGDRDLSPAAQRQLTGPEGYFRGGNGLPVDPPAPDRYGWPVLCPWMIEMGYSDLRAAP